MLTINVISKYELSVTPNQTQSVRTKLNLHMEGIRFAYLLKKRKFGVGDGVKFSFLPLFEHYFRNWKGKLGLKCH